MKQDEYRRTPLEFNKLIMELAATVANKKEPEDDEDDELTDEEYDNIYYGQVDETSDETYDGDFNPYAYNIYDDDLPDGFNSWSGEVKSAWRKKHKIGER